MYNEYNYNPYFNNILFDPQFFKPQDDFSFPYGIDIQKPYYDNFFDKKHIPMNQHTRCANMDVNTKTKKIDLNNTIRKLWVEHIIWTKLAIMSIANNSLDKELVLQRLLENPTDFEKVFAEYYDFETAKKFSNLFREHLQIAGELVMAAKDQDIDLVTILDEKLYNNADDISVFLNSINTYWDKNIMQKMMYEHLDLIKSEANYTLKNQYKETIDIFDTIENQALQMADMYTEGFIKEFPNRFV